MSSKNFELFNQMFPDSQYREINPQYLGPMDTEEGHQLYQASKAPVNNKILSYDEIKYTQKRVGWIVPSQYVVIDIDNMLDSKNVYSILVKTKHKFAFMKSAHGGHFIFKNTREIGNGAKYATGLGIQVDTRAMSKGYIILPHNDSSRSWGTITNEVSDVPFFLTPLKKLKVYTDFSTLKDGDGRNSKLFEHFMNLKDYAEEISTDEKVESIRLINNYILKQPLTPKELQETILRDENIKKESKKISVPKKPEELATRILEEYPIICSNEDLYLYNGKYYRMIPEQELERIIHNQYNRTMVERDRKEVIKFIRLKAWVEERELNKNWNEVVMKNGILNISEMKLYPHSPLVYNTIYIDHDYNPKVPRSGIIESFFNQLAHENLPKKQLLFEVVGYCFIRKNVYEKFFICYGEGSTGKSTYLNLIGKLLGEQNTTFLSLKDLNEKFHPAELFGKLANIGDDISSKFIEDSDILKKLISGQETMIQQKYKRPISFSNFAKLIYTANRIPSFEDRTSGMMRRMMLIEINKKIDTPDPFFLSKITEADYEYLMLEALKAAQKLLQRNHFTQVESVDLALRVFRQSQSSVLSFIEEAQLRREFMDGESCRELYHHYKQFCEEMGFKTLNQNNFRKEFADEMQMQIIYTTNGAGTTQQARFKLL